MTDEMTRVWLRICARLRPEMIKSKVSLIDSKGETFSNLEKFHDQIHGLNKSAAYFQVW